MALQGQLIDMPFEDLIELITYKNDITGTLFFDTGIQRGCIQVYNGDLFYASVIDLPGNWESPVLSGREAFHCISNWTAASFIFERNALHCETQNIFSNKRDLMLENLFKGSGFSMPQPAVANAGRTKRVAEMREMLLQPVPDYRARLRDLELSLEEWKILIHIDEINTVGQLAEIAEINTSNVYEAAQRLERAGVIVLAEPQTEPKAVKQPVSVFAQEKQARVAAQPIQQNAPTPKYKPQPAKRGLIGSLIAVLRGQK